MITEPSFQENIASINMLHADQNIDYKSLVENPAIHAFVISHAEDVEYEKIKALLPKLGTKPLWLLIASAKAVYNIRDLLHELSSFGIEALYFNSQRFLHDLGAQSQEHVDYARGELSLAAHDYHIKLIESSETA